MAFRSTGPWIAHRATMGADAAAGGLSRARLVPLEYALHFIENGHFAAIARVLWSFRVPRFVRIPHEIGPQMPKPHRERLGAQHVAERIGDGWVRPFDIAENGSIRLALLHLEGGGALSGGSN